MIGLDLVGRIENDGHGRIVLTVTLDDDWIGSLDVTLDQWERLREMYRSDDNQDLGVYTEKEQREFLEAVAENEASNV